MVAACCIGCLYTSSINMSPSILEIVGPTQVFRQQLVAYTASASDPDGEPLLLTWTMSAGRCPVDPSSTAGWPTDPRSTADTFSLTVLALDPFCIWAFATDPHGAIAARALQVTPANRPPTAAIDVVTPAGGPPYPLYGRIQLSAASSTDLDGDPLTFAWGSLADAHGSSVTLGPCSDQMGDGFRCFIPGVAGTYTAQLTVDDGFGGHSTAMRTIEVAEDQLPCLGVTSPPLDAPEIVRIAGVAGAVSSTAANTGTFSVQTVTDDGDPFPGSSTGVTTFSWFLGLGSDPVVYLGRNFPSYTMDFNLYSIGDEARVRVEISDRNQAAVAAVLLGCGDQPLCAGRPGCYQRATWTVGFR